MTDSGQLDSVDGFERRTGITGSDLDFFQTLPVFQHLAPDFLRLLLSNSTIREIDQNAPVYHHGEQSDRLYVVMNGRIKLFRKSADGLESVVTFAKSGESFGEAVIMKLETYPENASAIEASRLLVIPSADFVMKMRENAQLTLNVMSVMTNRLQNYVQFVEQRAVKPSAESRPQFQIQ